MKSKILLARDYGTPEVLEFHTQELPTLQHGMARIEVKFAGINPIDARRMTGEFKHAPMPQVFGTEFTGTIVDINGDSTFQIGDKVLGSGGSFTHATVIDVPVGNLIAKPTNISDEVAGTIAGAAQTAMTIIDELGPIRSLLIHGGSGGVGSIAIQIAKERGIEVVATASPQKQEYLQSLGAKPVIYGEGLTERIQAIHPQLFDAAVDMIGSEEATTSSLELVKPEGFIGGISGKPSSSTRVQPMWVKRNPTNLQYVVDRLADGTFQWHIDKVFPFDKAKDAYSYILEGHSKGKNALQF